MMILFDISINYRIRTRVFANNVFLIGHWHSGFMSGNYYRVYNYIGLFPVSRKVFHN